VSIHGTTDLRNLPALLRAAERRVNAHVFRTGGDDTLASIPANLDRDVDLLLMEAANEIEQLRAYIEDILTKDRLKTREINLLTPENKRLRMALDCLLPGLILDLRYATDDDDKDAMRSRIETVQDALAGPAVDVPAPLPGLQCQTYSCRNAAKSGEDYCGDCLQRLAPTRTTPHE
jgi:hypothetical protein